MGKTAPQQVRVRIAPSPTGHLHVGTARTALFNWLFAKNQGGKFILRIEDTDRERSKKEYEDSIVEGLAWLGITHDEFYRQSERVDVYKKYLEKLISEGRAYASREKRKGGLSSEASAKEEEIEVIRFKNPNTKITFQDAVRGEITFDTTELGDFVIAKSMQEPLFHLAVVVDDYEMRISHIIRGEDHISNTPRQILIQEAIGAPRPVYAHIPLILGADRSKLSKRHGAVSLQEYKKQGYLPEALFNFLALLGWYPASGEEVLSKEELVAQFSIDGFQKSGAIFDMEKLDWMSGEYIRRTPIEELTMLCIPYLIEAGLIQCENNKFQISNVKAISNFKCQITETKEGIDFAWLKGVVALEKDRMKKLSELPGLIDFIFTEKLDYDSKLLVWKDMTLEEVGGVLEELLDTLANVPENEFTKENLEKIIMPRAEQEKSGKIDRGGVLWPLRAALSGKKASPGPFEIMEVLGKEKSLARLREAMERLS